MIRFVQFEDSSDSVPVSEPVSPDPVPESTPVSDTSIEELFAMEVSNSHKRMPALGPRAFGGSIGGPTKTKYRKPIVYTPAEFRKHEAHEAQESCGPGCRLCDLPDYPFRNTPLIGRNHVFRDLQGEIMRPKVSSKRERVAGLKRTLELTIRVGSQQCRMGYYRREHIEVARKLAGELCKEASIRDSSRAYVIPPELEQFVPEIRTKLKERLLELGL